MNEELKSLIKQLFDMCDNGDFSNGIAYYGKDEGEIKAHNYLKELKEKYTRITGESI